MNVKTTALIIVLAGMVFGQAGLTGRQWRVTTLNGTSVGSMTYTINFKANDSSASGKIDCNSCGWRYKTSGQSITITGGFCTDMACSGPSRAGEYESALLTATKYALGASNLYLIKTTDTTAVFIDEAVLIKNLIGPQWVLQKLKGSSVNIAGYTLRFASDSTAFAHMQCNSCGCQYTASVSALSFGQAACTFVWCGSDTREGEFVTAMGNVTRWIQDGQRLFLLSAKDTLMEYIDAVTLGLTGKVWQLRSIRQASGRTAIAAPDKYTAEFKTDGNLSLVADCNTCNGTYSSTSNSGPVTGSLSVTGLGCTKMMCGPDSRGGLFAGIVGNAAAYGISGDTLFCFANTDTLVFTPKPTLVERRVPRAAPAFPGTMYNVKVAGRAVMVTGLGENVAAARIFDLRGAIVREGSAYGGSVAIHTRGLSQGMYLLQVVFSKGRAAMAPLNMAK